MLKYYYKKVLKIYFKEVLKIDLIHYSIGVGNKKLTNSVYSKINGIKCNHIKKNQL